MHSKWGSLHGIALIDGTGGLDSLHAGECLARWLAAAGVRTLLLETRAIASDEARTLEECERNLVHLQHEALAGFLAWDDTRLGRLAGLDRPMGEELLRRLAAIYDLLLWVGAADDRSACDISVPALLTVAADTDEGVRAAARVLEGIERGGGATVVSGFIFSLSDGALAARLARRWHLPFCGALDDVGHVAQRLIDRAVAVAPDPVPSAPIDAGMMMEAEAHLAQRVLAALREDPAFRNGRMPTHDAGAITALRERVAGAARRILHTMMPSLPASVDADAIVSRAVSDAVGFGPIDAFLQDAGVTEVMVCGDGPIFIERAGKVEVTSARFCDHEHLLTVIERMVAPVGRRIDESSAMVDARLPDGSRVNAVIPPLAVDGPQVTIRKRAQHRFDLKTLATNTTLTEEAARFFGACVRHRLSILVSGGTGSGKTTLLGALAAEIDQAERIITIEDAVELDLGAPHVVRLEARPPNLEGAGGVSIRDLVRNALRMRPDRIIVGECRGAEALDMLQAMNTGHEGSLTTVHANGVREALSRLETMVLMAGCALPLTAVREQIARAIDLIVQIARDADGARRVIEIAEITGMEGPTLLMQAIFTRERHGILHRTGLMPRFLERLPRAEFFDDEEGRA